MDFIYAYILQTILMFGQLTAAGWTYDPYNHTWTPPAQTAAAPARSAESAGGRARRFNVD